MLPATSAPEAVRTSTATAWKAVEGPLLCAGPLPPSGFGSSWLGPPKHG